MIGKIPPNNLFNREKKDQSKKYSRVNTTIYKEYENQSFMLDPDGQGSVFRNLLHKESVEWVIFSIEDLRCTSLTYKSKLLWNTTLISYSWYYWCIFWSSLDYSFLFEETASWLLLYQRFNNVWWVSSVITKPHFSKVFIGLWSIFVFISCFE